MPEPDNVLFFISLLRDCAYQYLSTELKRRGILGIEPSHGVILRQLGQRGPLSMSELAKLTGRTKPTVTVLVKKLIRYGYVMRCQDREDGRVFNVSLTQKALDLAGDLVEVSEGMRNTLFKGFSEEQKKDLVGLLNKAVGNLTSKQDGAD